jgi:hypothetical protein
MEDLQHLCLRTGAKKNSLWPSASSFFETAGAKALPPFQLIKEKRTKSSRESINSKKQLSMSTFYARLLFSNPV